MSIEEIIKGLKFAEAEATVQKNILMYSTGALKEAIEVMESINEIKQEKDALYRDLNRVCKEEYGICWVCKHHFESQFNCSLDKCNWEWKGIE